MQPFFSNPNPCPKQARDLESLEPSFGISKRSIDMEAEVGCESYYEILGVSRESSTEEIRRSYRKLAMQWHPDKWATTPSLLGEAKRKFQKIQEAYSVLSDSRKRAMYDAGMYDPTDEEDEGFCDFMQEMLSLMTQVREEEKSCSLEELQSMLVELAQGFDSSQWFSSPSMVSNHGCSSNSQQEVKPISLGRRSCLPLSSMAGTTMTHSLRL